MMGSIFVVDRTTLVLPVVLVVLILIVCSRSTRRVLPVVVLSTNTTGTVRSTGFLDALGICGLLAYFPINVI